LVAVSLATILLLSGCVYSPRIGAITPRTGDEIVVAGQFIHTRTPVVLWTDPGGYDAYRVERCFAPFEDLALEEYAGRSQRPRTPEPL